MKVKEEQMDSDQVDIKDKGGESYPDILERIKQILNKED